MFAALWLPLQARETPPSAPKVEVLGEYTAFRIAADTHPVLLSATADVRGASSKKRSGKLEVKIGATAMGRDYIRVPF